MAEITQEYIEGKRRMIQSQLDALNGAMDMLRIIEEELFPLTVDGLQQALGAVEVGQPQEVG